MQIDEIIKGRRSIRRYEEKDIPDYVIKELIDLARYAPTSMNGQPWHFIIIRNDKTKKQLTEIKNKYCPADKQSYQADFIQNTPVVIVVSVDKQKSYGREIENGVLATANIMLGAYSRGLGSVFMSAYRNDEPGISEDIRQALGIPQDIDPVTIIPLGFPDEIPEPKIVKSIKEVMSYESFERR